MITYFKFWSQNLDSKGITICFIRSIVRVDECWLSNGEQIIHLGHPTDFATWNNELWILRDEINTENSDLRREWEEENLEILEELSQMEENEEEKIIKEAMKEYKEFCQDHSEEEMMGKITNEAREQYWIWYTGYVEEGDVWNAREMFCKILGKEEVDKIIADVDE